MKEIERKLDSDHQFQVIFKRLCQSQSEFSSNFKKPTLSESALSFCCNKTFKSWLPMCEMHVNALAVGADFSNIRFRLFLLSKSNVLYFGLPIHSDESNGISQRGKMLIFLSWNFMKLLSIQKWLTFDRNKEIFVVFIRISLSIQTFKDSLFFCWEFIVSPILFQNFPKISSPFEDFRNHL